MTEKIPDMPRQAEAAEVQITHQKTIKSGRSVERLQLTPNNTAYNVAAKSIQPGFSLQSLTDRFTHVKVKTADGSFKLNIRSTAKRLGLTHQEVRDIAATGKDAVATLQEKAKVRQKALDGYEKIANSYVEQKGKLQAGKIRTGITPKMLLKVIQKGMTLEDNAVVFTGGKIELGKKQFLAGRDLSSLHVVQKKLGGGSYGNVFKTIELTNARIRAVKVSTGDIHESLPQLANESSVLRDLNKRGSVEGLPGKPSEITVLSDSKLSHGYIDMEFMDGGDLESRGSFMPSFQVLPASDRLRLCGQLICGLQHMHAQGYLHGDIKPENCLAKMDDTGQKPEKFVIADHGSTTKGIPRTYTPAFRPSDHIKESKESAKKSDVYALSKTLIEVLGSKRYDLFETPPQPIKSTSNEAKSIRDHLAFCGIPDSVAQVLIQGLGPANMRPDMTQLKLAYDSAVAGMTEEQKAAVSNFAIMNALTNM